MRSNSGKGKQIYYYYVCSKHRYDSKACTFRGMLDYKEMDKNVMNELKDMLTNTENKLNIYNEDTVIFNRRQQIHNELERAKKAYLAEVFSLEEYSTEKERLESELSLLEIKKPSNDIVRKNVKNMLEEFKQCSTVQEKKAKLQTVIKHVKVFESSVIIELHGQYS